jgi:aryl-alcohol dehydrogenase-like predicted oxidoreductase
MAAMGQLVDCGKVRFIGVSNFFVRDLKKAQKAMRKHKIVSNQVRYNLIGRTVEADLWSIAGSTISRSLPTAPWPLGLQAFEPKILNGSSTRSHRPEARRRPRSRLPGASRRKA